MIAVSIYAYLIKYQTNKKKIYYHITSKITNQKTFYIDKYTINMQSNDKLKEINIKNQTYYYFIDIIKFEYFDLDNILINEKSYENIL